MVDEEGIEAVAGPLGARAAEIQETLVRSASLLRLEHGGRFLGRLPV